MIIIYILIFGINLTHREYIPYIDVYWLQIKFPCSETFDDRLDLERWGLSIDATMIPSPEKGKYQVQ